MSLFDDLLNKAQPVAKTPDVSASSELTESFGQQTAQVTNNDSIIISNSTPIITSRDVLAEPVVVQTPIMIPVAAPIIEVTDSSLIAPGVVSNDFILTDPNTISFIENDISSVANDTETNRASPLFDMMSAEPMVTPTETAIGESLMDELSITPTTVLDDSPLEALVLPEAIATSATFRNTAEYLVHAVEEMKVLETRLVHANENKIIERDEYRDQKKHFAELEKIAEGEHKKMIEELKHAADMQEYLKKELGKDTAANDEAFAITA